MTGHDLVKKVTGKDVYGKGILFLFFQASNLDGGRVQNNITLLFWHNPTDSKKYRIQKINEIYEIKNKLNKSKEKTLLPFPRIC